MGIIKNLKFNIERLMLWGDKVESKMVCKFFGFEEVVPEIEKINDETLAKLNTKYNGDGGNKVR